ncbi:hypothetical protein KAU32_11215 [bacterium]|nr:hypothetical protein [bacterium]
MSTHILIQQVGLKYIARPIMEVEYEVLKNAGVFKGYYFKSTKSIVELTIAGVFSLYNSAEEAKNKIEEVDPEVILEYISEDVSDIYLEETLDDFGDISEELEESDEESSDEFEAIFDEEEEQEESTEAESSEVSEKNIYKQKKLLKRKILFNPSKKMKVGRRELIEEKLNNLEKGKILFNPSKEMKVGKREKIEVRITKKLTEDFINGLKGLGSPQIEEIKITPSMKVCLSGDNFRIKSSSSEEQIVKVKEYTEWFWNVIPLKSGKQFLSLTVSCIIEYPIGNKTLRDYPVMEKEVMVKVNPIYSVENLLNKNLKWLVAAIVGGIITLLFSKCS